MTPEQVTIKDWLHATGQFVIQNGQLLLWRRYKDSIYSESTVRDIYRVVELMGAKVKEC